MLDEENASWVLLAADRHSATRLKNYCLDWISKNAEKILDTESFRNLTASDPQLVVEILRVTSDPDGEAQRGIKRKRIDSIKKNKNKHVKHNSLMDDDMDDDFLDDLMPPPKQPPSKKRRSARRRS